MKGFIRRYRYLILAVLGPALWFALPLYPIGPSCANFGAGPDFPTYYDMSPLYRRVFADALERREVPYVVLGGWFFTWPWTAWGADYDGLTINMNKAVDGDHLLAGEEDVLVGWQETIRADLPPELMDELRAVMDADVLDECAVLALTVHIVPAHE